MTSDPTWTLPPIGQLGYVVADLDRAIDHYTNVFGCGPFRARELELDGFIYRGKRGRCRQRLAFGKSGTIDVELIQTIDGDETPHTQFLREKGEGLQHLGYFVENLDAVLNVMCKKGMGPVFTLDHPDFSVAYLDTDSIGGVMMELVEVRRRQG